MRWGWRFAGPFFLRIDFLCGVGGVFNMRRNTSSRLSSSDFDMGMANALSKYRDAYIAGPPTPDQLRDAYHLALGRFLDTFSQIEATMHQLLWHYAKTRFPIAQAVFSGLKIDAEMGLVTRLTEVRRVGKAAKADLEYVFAQLRDLNSARNDILHYGSHAHINGERLVSNFLLALNRSRLREFPISDGKLRAMHADCVKIIVHLRHNHIDRKKQISEETRDLYQYFLHEPWSYKHPPVVQPKQQKQPGKGRHKRARVRAARRRPSQEKLQSQK